MIRKIFNDEEKMEVKSFRGLLVEFARKNGTNTVIAPEGHIGLRVRIPEWRS